MDNEQNQGKLGSPVAKPLIGLAISVVCGVVSLMLLISLCGYQGHNGGMLANVAFPLFFASALSGIICFIWFIVVLATGD